MKRVLCLVVVLHLLLSMQVRAVAADDYSPFIKGNIKNEKGMLWPAVVLIMETGGSMGAGTARVFVDDGASGVVDMGTVEADGGDNLWAFFSGGTLYFQNRVQLPGQSHAEGALHLAIQRAHLVNHRLKFDQTITIEAPTSQTTFFADVRARADQAIRKRGF